MAINRVQKLLLSEYCDFEDIVLIESPFAQTTKQGTGLRQVHLGLTPSKLILAADILPPIEPDNIKFNPFIDPEIETFELVAIYPVECVNLSIYRRKSRQAIKARFCNNKVLYFELGGFERRGMFWNLWCEKVKFLCPGNSGSSRSETSVATSTSGSSLYLVDKKIVAQNGIRQLWCRFGPNFAFDNPFLNGLLRTNSQSLVRKWTDRYLYLGKDIHESVLRYKPIMKLPSKNEFVKQKKSKSRSKHVHPTLVDQKNLAFGDSVQVNRFGSGVYEGCGTGLYLTVDDYKDPKLTPSFQNPSSDLSTRSVDYEEIAETAVLIWEYYGFQSSENRRKIRHRRRYGFAPKPLFLYGLGPWHVSKGDTFSVQLKRALSDINLNNSNNKKALRLPVSRRQLYATVSCPVLHEANRTNNIINAPKKPVIFFWTPGYWYRPISAKDAYGELQKHLKKIREYHQSIFKCNRKKCSNRRFLRKFNMVKYKETDEDEDFSERRKRKRSFISSMLSSKAEHLDYDDAKDPNETPLQYLQRILKVNIYVTAWDFDSTTLAEQLTMIDRDLFLKVSSSELEVLVWQRSSKNAPNIAAMIAFSYRISCLIASEILRDESEKIRARLLARFINVANKCHRLSNFHSCRTVLCGLQTPAIFRLRKTWAYVRKKHASKYQEFEYLCRLYRDPRMPSFQKIFFIFSQHPPYLPWIGHIITKLFDKIPEYKVQKGLASRQLSFCSTNQSSSSYKTEIPSQPERQINLFSKIFGVFSNPLMNCGDGDASREKRVIKRAKVFTNKSIKFRSLYEYFKPLKYIEDNRKEMLIEVTELLEKSQLAAINYNFICNEMARDFLLKARYTEEQDNFFNSISLESS